MRTTTRSRRLSPGEWLAVGLGSGLFGGVALAAPIVIWDWVRAGHLAFELPMAITAWLFGLNHFSHAHYLGWSGLIGVALFAASAAISGIAFTGVVDRLYGITRLFPSVAAGLVWGFFSFIFFWDMVLPIARDGVPLRAASRAPGLFAAPNWTWVLGFALLGLFMGLCHSTLRRSPAHNEVEEERGLSLPPLRHAA